MACLPPGLVTAMLLSGLWTSEVCAQEEGRWTDAFALSGDLRLRYESIEEEDLNDRERERYRARLSLSATANDKFKAVIQLASGGDNPVSANQDFEDSLDIRLDLAYVDWTPNDHTHAYGGTMNNPLFRVGDNPLIWDGDLNPEGIAMAFEPGRFFGSIGGFVVAKRSGSDDSWLYTGQGGVKLAVADGAIFTVGAGYYHYTNTIGNKPFYRDRPKGNSVDGEGNFLFNYHLLEFFAQYEIAIGNWPFTVFTHWVQNTEVDIEDTAYALGVKVGKAREQGTMQFSWAFMDIGADAAMGIFTDSDFAAGNTDARGHLLKGKYALTKSFFLGGTLILTDVDISSGNKHDYTRLQLDIEFKF